MLALVLDIDILSCNWVSTRCIVAGISRSMTCPQPFSYCLTIGMIIHESSLHILMEVLKKFAINTAFKSFAIGASANQQLVGRHVGCPCRRQATAVVTSMLM